MPWEFSFEECGGYDCMTDAFVIRHNDEDKIVLDLANFGQPNCEPISTEAKAEAEELAKYIVDALNKREQVSVLTFNFKSM